MADVTVGILIKAGTEKAKKAFNDFGSVAKKTFVGVAAATAIGIGGLLKYNSHAAEIGAEAFRMADALSTSTEFLTQMGFAAGQVGGSLEDVESVMGDLTQRALNNKADFERWGISATKTNGVAKTSEELFRSLADRVQLAGDDMERFALVDELAADAGRRLLPVLRGGSKGLDEWAKRADAAGATVDSLSARMADRYTKEMDQAKASTNALSVVGGSILQPVLIALVARYNKTGAAVGNWVKANRELLQSKVAAFFTWLADNALPAIATGADLTAKVFLGWKLLFQTLQNLSSKFIEVTLRGFASIADKAAALADKVGAGGIAKSLRSVAARQREVAIGFGDDADAALAAMVVTRNQITSTEAVIGKFGSKASAALREVVSEAAAVAAEMEKAGATGSKGGERISAGLDAAKEKSHTFGLEVMRMFRARRLATEKEIANINLLAQVEAEAAVKSEAARKQNLAMTTGMIGALGQIAEQTIKAGFSFKALALSALEAAKQVIMAAAAKGAAEAAAGTAGIPVIGFALATAAASAAFALISGFASKFQTGGMVPGRGSGDIVPAFLEPGELVVRKSLAPQAVAAGFGPAGNGVQRGGSQPRGGDHYHFHETLRASEADLETHLREKFFPLMDERYTRGAA